MIRLAVVNHHGGTPGGGEISLLLQLEALPPDIEPHIFLLEDGEFADLLRSRFRSVKIVPMSGSMARSSRSKPKLKGMLATPAFALRLANHLRLAEPDVVLTNSMKAHVVGSLAAKSLGLPCINNIRDIPTGFAQFVTRAVSRACSVERMTCSKAAADSLGLPQTTVLYSPIDLSKYAALPPRSEARARLGIPDDGLPVVSLVGRIARWKGQDRFLRSAALVRREIDAHFVVAGSPIFGNDADFFPQLQALVAEQKAEARVHFIPWQDDPRDVYAASDLSCNCSAREPFGRTIIEAMACGVPVIAFADAGACEAFIDGESGAKVPVGDETAYAAAILGFLRDPARLQSAREAAARDAAGFEITHLAKVFRAVVYRAAAPLAPPGQQTQPSLGVYRS
jgi:glycosyltransferase involved in cell wall biosynthesis